MTSQCSFPEISIFLSTAVLHDSSMAGRLDSDARTDGDSRGIW
jgi:hypothetical protein